VRNKYPVILNLSAVDYGGAGKFSVDFHRLLISDGAESYLIVKESKAIGDHIIQYRDTRFNNAFHKLLRRINKRKLTDKLFTYDYYFYNKYERYTVVSARKILALMPSSPDVIFIHWATDFINAKVISELNKLTDAKIFCLLIDNAPLTGGCHYPWNCLGFTTDCSNCPAILSDDYKRVAAKNLAFKMKYLPDDMGVIAFSESDYGRTRKSALFRNRPVVKFMGFVDETLFKPGDKAEVRNGLGIPAEKKVLFFGASSLSEKRKGMQLLLEALSMMKQDDLYLLIAGSSTILEDNRNTKYLGYLSENELIRAYQSADVFICPSIEDSGPMMINQSLMCGTPVVAFNTGVAQDLVINGKTGYRAAVGDTNDLTRGIKEILALDIVNHGKLSSACRALALKMCSRDAMLTNIKNLIC
jgi:glycosyltransferase involved in cell wall biosynthesis